LVGKRAPPCYLQDTRLKKVAGCCNDKREFEYFLLHHKNRIGLAKWDCLCKPEVLLESNQVSLDDRFAGFLFLCFA
jgi:hypothetical protein